MIAWLLAAQLAATDSSYSTPALRAVVAEAAQRNRRVPPALRSYRADLESEIALVLRQSQGYEQVAQIEQLESRARWHRTGDYEQRVTGYRVQAAGPSLSALSWFRQAWTVPVLYGNRMALFFGPDTSRARPSTTAAGRRAEARRRARERKRATNAVHPLADDRDAVYRYSGGDTVMTLRVAGRAIPIVRVTVTPRPRLASRFLLFRGEMDIDASRRQLVRLRGHFVRTEERPGMGGRLLRVASEGVLYVELVNGEVDEKYWLPAYQRLEAQVASPLTGDARSILRIVTRFRRYAVNDSGPLVATPDDTLAARPHTLSFAPRDSVARFGDWDRGLGDATAGTHADDFEDVAPESWRITGPPRLEVRAQRFSDILRYNRVEGLYTGLPVMLRTRDALPGLTVTANAGWGWTERAVRGVAGASWARGRWLTSARAGRTLASTNDFLPLRATGLGLEALIIGRDDQDYVDRRFATLALAREFGGPRGAVVRVETGSERDAPVRRRVGRAPLLGDSAFRPNRYSAPGRAVRSAIVLEYHPDVNAELVRPGVGALLMYERGDGDLEWQRWEGRVDARRIWRAITVASRLDAGTIIGAAPPQRLYELGDREGLPGYRYKEFGGNQAAVLRGLVMYTTPWLRSPARFWRSLYLPGLSPAISIGAQGGWTGLSGSGARASLALLGAENDPATRAPVPSTGLVAPVLTRGIRSTVDARLRFFGGALSVGIARPVDHGAKWKVVFGVGGEW